MKLFLIILFLTLPTTQGINGQIPWFLHRAAALAHEFPTKRIRFDLDNELRAAGLSTNSSRQECLFKKTEATGITKIKSVCNKVHSKLPIYDAFVHSKNRHLVYIDCGTDQKDSTTHNTKKTINSCHCKTLRLNNANNIQVTSYSPGCVDQQIKLPEYLLHGQEHLAVLALSNIPDLFIQPGAFDNLLSLDFVSLADNGLSTGDLPLGLFCNSIKLRKLHLQGSQFNTFPSQLFTCSQTKNVTQCLPQLSDVIIRHTSIEAIPSSPFGCAWRIIMLLLPNNHIASLKPFTFQHLSKLKVLELSSNRFTRLEAIWFSRAKSLKVLFLTNNQISSIDGSFAPLCLISIHMSHNILRSISANVFNSDCLSFLDVSSNKLATFAVGSLSDLDKIYDLNFYHNNITSMTTVAKSFNKSGKYLRRLFLNDNGIAELKEFDFQPFNNLQILVLNNNYIKKIHPLAFSNLHRLKLLNLENNLITYIGSHFSTLRNLVKLFLGRNKLKKITAEMFHGLHNLLKLYMDNNLIDHIDNTSFKDLHSITLLKMGNNNLTYLDDNVIPASVEYLNLSYNLLENIPCSTYRNNLKALHLNHNRISLIKIQPKCFRSKLDTLYIKRNFIKTIEPGAFLSCSQLRYLELDGNHLHLNFTLNYFTGTPLVLLNLSVNKIISLENLFLHQPMARLQKLYLSNNPITNVPKQPTFSALKEPLIVYIVHIWLNSCNIASIHRQAFANFKNLEYINLSWNLIRSFPNLQLPKQRILVIDMYLNKIECSCKLKWLKTNKYLLRVYNIGQCYNPVNDHVVSFKKLPAELFVCKTDAECDTTMCSCFKENQNSGPAIIDCSDRNSSSLPKLFSPMAGTIYLHKNNYKYLSLSQNSSVAYRASILTLHHCHIEKMAADSFNSFRYLKELYLNDNRIKSLEYGIFAHLTLLKKLTLNGNLLEELSGDALLHNADLMILNLHNNSLKEFTTQTRQVIKDLYYLTTLSLYDNPWICKCDNNSWKIWLSDLQPKLTNSLAIECDNGTSILKTPDDFFLCPNDTVIQTVNVIQNVRGYALAVSLPVILLSTVIIVMALSFYNRYFLAVFMFSHWGIRFSKDTTADDYTFDAILLYDEDPESNQDFSSNDTIIDVIHSWMTSVDPPYEVMLPIVDIEGGTNWAEEIARGISNSKKSVFYITMEFLEKQQTMSVFGIAYSTSMERKSTDLILIIDNKQTLKYIRSSENEDPRLKALLRANKCILYHDKHFFNKLMYLLPGKKRTLNPTATEKHMLVEL